LCRDITAKIVDDKGVEVADGDLGNLQVKGDSMAAFYYRQHDKSKASMLENGSIPATNIIVMPRVIIITAAEAMNMLKVGGIWVSPIEIEDTLMSHPAVLETAGSRQK